MRLQHGWHIEQIFAYPSLDSRVGKPSSFGIAQLPPAQAARAVLSNQKHVQQMQNDYRRIDFVNVQEQVAWVCDGCDASLIAKYVMT